MVPEVSACPAHIGLEQAMDHGLVVGGTNRGLKKAPDLWIRDHLVLAKLLRFHGLPSSSRWDDAEPGAYPPARRLFVRWPHWSASSRAHRHRAHIAAPDHQARHIARVDRAMHPRAAVPPMKTCRPYRAMSGNAGTSIAALTLIEVKQ